ncbi:FtsX-like permease family protein [Pseudoroseicyclus tamaricis]|uniref:ABC transporter permease n=1 Tax=Pseudoroseicyclus tamaricis TaxID=2705421 RepID=A0A6B2JKK7_9RHOB|nr:FtsX-like permease family protein [Pseudoroseicyclus tamaricis]NDV02031.1 ABC transporter permease [Pseudoroseicyclus tamaricis]
MRDLWFTLPPAAQDLLAALLLLLPALVIAAALLRGFAPGAMIRDMGRRFLFANVAFVALIACAIAIGAGLLASERGLRAGTARAADPFDLIIAAPGSELTAMLAAVYLQPADMPLLSGETYARIAADPAVALAAPLAFGDSVGAAPVVGTTAGFAAHLSPELAEGRLFAAHDEAVVGALAGFAPGDEIAPAHGVGDAADAHAHAGHEFQVVGRMARTGSPWDRAVLVPVEAIWEVHGLANGHAPEAGDQLGPPFDAAYFPGTPAVLLRGEGLGATYQLLSRYGTEETMAFFPGAVLAQLQARLGDVRAAMSVMAVAAQVLVTLAVLLALAILVRLFARALALLRALGAPGRFVAAVVWSYAVGLVVLGTALGLALGLGSAAALSAVVTARTDILVRASLGWPEVHMAAGFVSLTAVLALLPAWAALRREIVPELRA